MTTSEHVRSLIRSQVAHIQPFDSTEQEHKADIIAWIDSGDPLFRIKKPDVPLKHLVSYFVLIDPEHDSLLLVDHIKAQLWLPTGGHVMPNEDPRDTVRREAEEELNIQATFLRGDSNPFFMTVTETVGLTAGHFDVSLWYLLRGSVHDFLQYDKSEFTDVEWFTFKEVLEMDPVIFDPHLQRFTKKVMDYLHTTATS